MRSTTLRTLVEGFVPRTLTLLRREFPNGIGHVLHSADDAHALPSALHPSFYGCFDWHSAVHSCWQVVRALRAAPGSAFEADARAVLDELLAPERLAIELRYLEPRPGFERPYGLAWLLQLCTDLRVAGSADADMARWLVALAPLESTAAARVVEYAEKLPRPVRSGAHDQTAFSLGLALDWAQVAGELTLRSRIAERCRGLYREDRDAPLAFEPSGTDFLSPALAEADLMRRVLPPDDFANWFDRFLGRARDAATGRLPLAPVDVSDPSDGKLAHFAGLNMSRAWMLRAIGRALGGDAALETLADEHEDAGLPLALHDDYMVSHWAPSFALYLLTDAVDA